MNAVYARQSLDKKDSISIEMQIDLCKREIGDAPIKIYIDKGFSGKNTNRPQFREMMNDIKQGLIEKVVVYKLDRLSRSLLDFAEMIDTFKRHNVEFNSAREKFDTSTPIGNAMLSIIMVFAQLERETIQMRVQDSFYARSSKGAYDCVAPYGYVKDRITINGKKTSSLKIDDAAAVIVNDIFYKYAYTNTSLGFLAKRLNNQHIPSPGGAEWDSCKLSRIMANPVYVMADADVYRYYKTTGIKITNPLDDFAGTNGCVTYGKWDHTRRKFDQLPSLSLSIGLHKGIIDSETFLCCQYKLNANTQLDNSSRGKHSWLTGIIKCGYCGKAMKVSCGKRQAAKKFVCSGATNYGTCSQSERTLVSDVEGILSAEIMKHVGMRRDLTASVIEKEDLTEKRLKIEVARLDEQIGNLIQALADASEVTTAYVNEKIAELENLKNEAVIKLQQHCLSKTSEKNAKQFEDILSMWDDMSIEQKHEIATMLVSSVKVLADKIQIDWKYSFSA